MATRLLPFAFLLLLCTATPTPASAVEATLGDLGVLALEEEGLEAEAAAEGPEEECEEIEEGVEDCEEAEPDAEQAAAAPPQGCVLRSARGHAAVDRRGTKLKLTIGYTAYEPAMAKIEIRKGTGRIGWVKRQLGRSGVVRVTKKLGAKKRGERIVVSIQVPSARNAGCPFRRLVLFPR
jgi:hypothetical protein